MSHPTKQEIASRIARVCRGDLSEAILRGRVAVAKTRPNTICLDGEPWRGLLVQIRDGDGDLVASGTFTVDQSDNDRFIEVKT